MTGFAISLRALAGRPACSRLARRRREPIGVVTRELDDVAGLNTSDVNDCRQHSNGFAPPVVGVVLDKTVELPVRQYTI